MERRLETLRLRLLRLVAGLLAVVVFVSIRPFSPAVSRWVSGFVLSILSRAETAAQYVVIVQARIIAARTGRVVNPEQVLEYGLRGNGVREDLNALCNLRERLEALRALLEDVPRHGLRLLRRIEKRVRGLMRAVRMHEITPESDRFEIAVLNAWRLAEVRDERPPDKSSRRSRF